MSETLLDQVKELVTRLERQERTRLAAWLDANLGNEGSGVPRRSLYGLCADLGVAPSEAEIGEAREAVWDCFPREDVV